MVYQIGESLNLNIFMSKSGGQNFSFFNTSTTGKVIILKVTLWIYDDLINKAFENLYLWGILMTEIHEDFVIHFYSST